MRQDDTSRFRWEESPNAVEKGFDFYLGLLERRLKGDDVSLVQNLRSYFQKDLGINLRETQVRGLMHRDNSVFTDYVKAVSGQDFTPGIQHWEEKGLSNFYEWQDHFFEARKRDASESEADNGSDDIPEESGRGCIVERMRSLTDERDSPPGRQSVEINRIIRDYVLSRFLKLLYHYQCQICRFSFTLPSGALYAESHHVKPVGRKYRGLDVEDNMLVLCPNHHAMMDCGVIAIHPDKLVVVTIDDTVSDKGKGLQLLRHNVRSEFLEYHLSNVFNKIL